jgi:ankyrin repeat protein
LGYDEVVELLLRKDRSNKIRLMGNDNGRLPVHIAAKNGHLAAVRALMNQDENTLATVDREGCTPLSLAACGNSKSHAETVKFLIEFGAALSHRQLDGSTPLHQAARSGNESSIRYLLGEDCVISNGEKIDLDERDTRRSTALSLAAAHGHEIVVELLLKHGAGTSGSELGTTPHPDDRDLLSWAAGHGMTEAIQLLLQY